MSFVDTASDQCYKLPTWLGRWEEARLRGLQRPLNASDFLFGIDMLYLAAQAAGYQNITFQSRQHAVVEVMADERSLGEYQITWVPISGEIAIHDNPANLRTDEKTRLTLQERLRIVIRNQQPPDVAKLPNYELFRPVLEHMLG